MKAPEYTRANQWAAHAKEGKLQKKAEVLARAEPTLLEKYSDPARAQGVDQTQFEIPVVDSITQSINEKQFLNNPVASNLLNEGN